jgi:3-oxoacyl-[acyl-carrier-protein] synthase-3
VSVLIRGTGSALPERVLSNADLEKIIETNDEWIVTRTGIRERRMLAPEEATSDIVTRAAQRALEMAKLTPEDLDLIIVATCTPDTFTPATANHVHRNLCRGLAIPAFDVNAACSGFVYGLDVATSMLQSTGYKRVLLAGGEGLTRFMDYQERTVCILFGDAAGAVVLERSDEPGGVLATTLKSDGQYSDLIQIPGGGARRPASPYVLAQRETFVRMNGPQVFKVAVQSMEQVARDTLAKVGWGIEEVDWVIAHQANKRILGRCRPARRADGEDAHEPRGARQHVGGVDPAAARRVQSRRPLQARRQAAAGRIRRRSHLGRVRGGVDSRAVARAQLRDVLAGESEPLRRAEDLVQVELVRAEAALLAHGVARDLVLPSGIVLDAQPDAFVAPFPAVEPFEVAVAHLVDETEDDSGVVGHDVGRAALPARGREVGEIEAMSAQPRPEDRTGTRTALEHLTLVQVRAVGEVELRLQRFIQRALAMATIRNEPTMIQLALPSRCARMRSAT